MIISDTVEERKANLKAILPLQENDFFNIIKTMEGRAVTIRLLDPPLNEFVQAETPELAEALAKKLGVDVEFINKKYAELNEHNPMLGHRGCRLAITYPEIYEMQVEAIARATAQLDKEGVAHEVQIMIPNVVSYREVEQIRGQAEAVIAKVNKETGRTLKFAIGSMVEFPRTALIADKVANFADFFSFGTNDFDIFTMNILEQFLMSFKGCLLIVSHDRYFMDKVCDTLFIMEKDGSVSGFVGKCSEYVDYREEQERQKELAQKQEREKAQKENQAAKTVVHEQKKKRTFREQKEFEELEIKIAEMEDRQKELEGLMASTDYEAVQKAGDEYKKISEELETAYSRWEELAQ